MKTIILVLCVLSLTACSTLPANPTNMSPEQLKEWAKIKDATVGCAKGTYAGANVVATWANVDRGIPAGLTIGEDCKITFDSKKSPTP